MNRGHSPRQVGGANLEVGPPRQPRGNLLLQSVFCLLFSVICHLSCAPKEEVVKKEPPEAEAPELSEAKKYYSFGREYLKNKLYDEAIKNFKLAIKDSSSYVDAYISLGLAYRGKKAYGEEENVYRQMIEIAPAKGHYALGKLYTDERRYEEALAQYKKAIKIDTGYVDALYGIGFVQEKLGNIKAAIEEYKYALRLDPENESVRFCLGKTYIANEEYGEAIKELKILRDSHPEDLDVRVKLGEALLAINHYKAAREEFEYITGRSPSDIASRLNLGKACEGLKDYESAVKVYEEAISIDTTDITPYCYLIGLYIELGNLIKADKFLRIAERINPESQLLHYFSGTVLLKRGDGLFEQKEYSSAMSTYEKAISEYKLVIKGDDPTLVDNARKAIKSAESKLKRAKEEEWWHRR